MAQIYNSNLDAVTLGSTPAGWVALSGAFIVQDAAGGGRPVSGTRATFTQAEDGKNSLYTAAGALANMEIQHSHKVYIAGGDVSMNYLWLRANADVSIGYRIDFIYSGGNLQAHTLRFGAGGFSTAMTGAPFAVATNDLVYIAARIVGGVISVYMWKSTGSRPATPTFTLTDASPIAAAGYPGFSSHTGTTSAAASSDDIIVDDMAADTLAPVLSSPTGTSSGATTGTASVSTNEGAGTAWCLTLAASASDPDGPTIEASGTSKSITATGVQSWPTRTSLTTGVPVKNWFYQKDPSGNGSNVVSSASFTPTASNAAPTFTGNIANITGTGGAAITPVTVASAFADTDALTYSASPGGTAWPSGLTINPTTGAISGTVGTSTTTGLKVRATDTASQTVDSNAFSVTMSAAPVAGTLTTQDFKNGTGQVLANLTGLNVSVLAVPSGAFVKSFASETTDAGGFNSVTDALIVPGTKYAHITINSAGTVIGAELITAT
ncbi:putative Ig domain-containing protein [Massilia yuzhufengensis]|uniref:Putative Ig domain-containing protein n=1 Tax=Massilia yuzhufengensis TaxID=1164594 RepID=A0A1I1VSP3_9BURK|nr:putative Ig domain-containing protein [Massilia yuzhufengensis]SFD83560.1 Putative Ig domain-containing protein [Massilia yuzhufengensis]